MPERVVEDGIIEVELTLEPNAQPRDDGHDEPYEKHDTKVGQMVFNLAG
jgi:hypothetical protein